MIFFFCKVRKTMKVTEDLELIASQDKPEKREAENSQNELYEEKDSDIDNLLNK